MSHEHILVDNWQMTFDYDFILDNEELAVKEVGLYAGAGGATICDTTSRGLGRDPDALARISKETGVHIVMGAGCYREAVYPPWFDTTPTNMIAADLVDELVFGVDKTGVRPGFIGEIGTERGAISPREERMFRAAARAHNVTGCPIATHTTHWGELGIEQVDLLMEEGVAPDSIIIGHLGDRFQDDLVMAIAERGVWLSVDNLAFVEGYAPLEVRADNVARLWDSGFGQQIMLSSDICNLSQLSTYGGPGYANVLKRFIPLLHERGLESDQTDQMLVENPSLAFSYAPRVNAADLDQANLVALVEASVGLNLSIRDR